VAISPAVKRIYTEIGINPEQITVVPNGIEPGFRPSDPESSSDDGSGLELLYVGRLRRKKGIDVLIDALSHLDSTISGTIVGDGPQSDNLLSHAVSNGVEDRLSFRGWVNHDQLPSLYASADLFVHPGRWPEPFGRTVLETMQCGTPPVVSDIGAPPWIVGDAGVTFKPESPTALADAIRTLEEEAKRTRYSNRAESELRRFQPDLVFDQIENIYSEIVT